MRSLIGVIVILAACGDNRGGGPDANPAPPDGAPPDAAQPGDPTQGAWVDRFGLPGPSGFGSRVEDVAIATDGSVYAAGIFQDAAGVPAANIAHWTGFDWAPLGPGLDGWVRAIAFDAGGTLWAAVTSEDVTSATLARWDGTAWTVANTLDGAIRDLAITTGGIAVVGDFTGGVRVLDTSDDSWTNPAPGGVGNGAPSAVAATPTGFCLAGSFDAIDGVAAENAACFDAATSTWTALGSGLPGGVAVLARAPGGQWFAGGTLTFIVDQTTGEYEAGIGRLAGGAGGTWQPFQGGIDNGFINEVRAIAFDGADVLVGGHFQTAGASDVPASHLARFTPGTGWSEINGGLVNDVGVFLPSIIGTGDIEIASDGTLWVGGLFTRAGGTPAVNMAAFPTAGPPTALVSRAVLGVGGFVDTLAAAPGGVLAGGLFAFGGQTPLANVGIYLPGALDTPPWAEVGGGLPGSIVRDALVLPGDHVAIAGELFIDGAPAAYAEWDGAAWTLPGGRVDGAGFALVQDAGGTIWLGGDLFEANGAPIANLAQLSHGVWAGDGTFDGRVSSLALQGDTVIAGGTFTMVDGVPAAAIAVRDAEGTWTELGGGTDGDFAYVNAVAVSPALGVIVGGEFEGIGGTTAVDLAAWNGSTWSPLASGFSTTEFTFVSAITPYGDGVFVSGGFNAIGGGPASNVAWFDGAAWHPLGAGLADLAEEMVVINDWLFIGGPFTAAGGRPASGIAAWDFNR